MKQHYDAIIIGGGASGLMCAIAAKRKNPRMSVAIIEKNDRVGKKLLSTGNGRCNLTNANVAPDKYVGNGAKKLVGAVLQKYGVQGLLDYFGTLGLLTSKDSEGRYYPLSRQASTVLDVLPVVSRSGDIYGDGARRPLDLSREISSGRFCSCARIARSRI